MKYFFRALSLSTLFFSPHIWAEGEDQFFPLPPRVSILGLTGDYSLLYGDAMAPVFGNGRDIWYLDAQSKSAFQTSWLVSAGAGFREIENNDQIWGAYLFFDRTVSSQNQSFWFAAPGVETLGRVWDVRLNGYIPISSTRVLSGTGFADEFGDYSYVQVSGHNQFDAIVDNYEQVGWGLDGEVGRVVPFTQNLRVYAGGYHFQFDHERPLNGFAGRVEYWMDRFVTIAVRDTYDNQRKNTVEASLQYTLGGLPPSRILDPIERNLATLGQGNGEPVVASEQVVENSVLERSNIWFFETDGGTPFINSLSCTAEAPCWAPAFNQGVIDQINGFALSPANPSFYFKSGHYSALNGDSPLVLTNDSLFSRTENYHAPKQGAIFDGAFNVFGLSTFSYVTLLNDKNIPQPFAINLNAAGQLTLVDSIIGPSDNNLYHVYATAIALQDAALSVTQNSQIYAYSNTSTPAIGINATDSTGSQITIDSSQIFAAVEALNSTTYYTAEGIATSGAGTASAITVQNHSSINASMSPNYGLVTVAGIAAAETTNTVNISGESSVSGAATMDFGDTINVSAVSLTGATNTLAVSGNSQLAAAINLTSGNQYFPNDLTAQTVHVSGANNQISIQGGSQLNASINSQYSELAVARAIDVSDQGSANTQITVNDSQLNSSINASNIQEFTTPHPIEGEGIYIDTTGASGSVANTINLNNAAINVSAIVQSVIDTGYSNRILAQGIAVDSFPTTDSVNNTVNVTGGMISVTAQMLAQANANPYIVTTAGINLNSGDNSSNNVSLNTVNLQANSLSSYGSQGYDQLTAGGVLENTGANSTNTVQIANNSTVTANSQMTNAGVLEADLYAYGVNTASADNSANIITVGAAGNLNDSTTVTGSATIENTASSNVVEELEAYGIFANGLSGTNTLLVQGNAAIEGMAQTNNIAGNTGQSNVNAWGIYTANANSATTLSDTSSILSNAAGLGSSMSVTAIGIESVALGTNTVSNWDGSNNNISAIQNGVNDGVKIKMNYEWTHLLLPLTSFIK